MSLLLCSNKVKKALYDMYNLGLHVYSIYASNLWPCNVDYNTKIKQQFNYANSQYQVFAIFSISICLHSMASVDVQPSPLNQKPSTYVY